ncbi:hypothetical protein AVEN_78563-1 [Araneus ventricosus]|uniref:Uncharacterized protein n=1 Tax=Araneus ventricosus TaxID=182803 RepID=A0A4Y2L9E0_ARAVE|nr:hypothetical protein AVEN_78563-1 [Araneus ventricosus]
MRYPQLRFVKRAKRTQCELVLHETPDADVARSLDSVSCTSSDSDSSIPDESNKFSVSDMSNKFHSKFSDSESNKFSVSDEVLQTLYSSSLTLKSYIDSSPSLECVWPPSATDLIIEAAESLVPSTLFNFLAWITGISNDLQLNEYVSVNEKSKRNYFL